MAAELRPWPRRICSYVLASRHLERIADHATNIAEDILFWVRGLEVRHGRAKQMEMQRRERQPASRYDRNSFSRSAHRGVQFPSSDCSRFSVSQGLR